MVYTHRIFFLAIPLVLLVIPHHQQEAKANWVNGFKCADGEQSPSNIGFYRNVPPYIFLAYTRSIEDAVGGGIQ